MLILTPQQIVSHIAGELRAYYTKHYANGLSYKTDMKLPNNNINTDIISIAFF